MHSSTVYYKYRAQYCIGAGTQYKIDRHRCTVCNSYSSTGLISGTSAQYCTSKTILLEETNRTYCTGTAVKYCTRTTELYCLGTVTQYILHSHNFTVFDRHSGIILHRQ